MSKLTRAERETHAWISDADDHWHIATDAPAFARMLAKRGWHTTQEMGGDTIHCMLPREALTIRKASAVASMKAAARRRKNPFVKAGE